MWVPREIKINPIEFNRFQASLVVWGAISYDQNSILEIRFDNFNADKYLNLLRRRLLKNFSNLNKEKAKETGSIQLLFQQDGASIHSTVDITDYFQRKHIEVIPWPARSPDLNIIEHVWSKLKDGLKKSYQSVEDLESDVKSSWNNLDLEYIKTLYKSMRHRIQAVIDEEGGPTEY